MLDKERGEVFDSCYVFKVRFDVPKGSKVLYSIGWSADPVSKLQSILRSFYDEVGYFPKATVLRSVDLRGCEQINEKLCYELIDNLYFFREWSFVGSSAFYSVDEKELLSLFDIVVPSLDGCRLISKLPESFYLMEEKDRISRLCLEQDEDYFVLPE